MQQMAAAAGAGAGVHSDETSTAIAAAAASAVVNQDAHRPETAPLSAPAAAADTKEVPAWTVKPEEASEIQRVMATARSESAYWDEVFGIKEEPGFRTQTKLGRAQVFVKYISGKEEAAFDVEGTNTVLDLMKQVETKWGCEPCTQRLVYHMRQLDPERTLDSYQIEPDAFLTLVLRMSGS